MRTRRVRPSLLRLEDRTTPAAFELHGDTLTVNGTSGDDSFAFTAGETAHTVTLNGVSFEFDRGDISTVNLVGNGGHDTAELNGDAEADTAVLRYQEGALIGSDYFVAWEDLEVVLANGQE